MSESQYVHSDLRVGVLTITLTHPKANAFTMEMILSIQGMLREAVDDERVRCVLLTGSGDIFSAGHDLNEVLQHRDESFHSHLARTFNPLILQIRQLEKPVVAAINGPVAGAALGVILACDLRIASEKAQFLVGFLGVGLSFDSGVSLFLPRLIGLGRASEYTFTNAPISAQQALEWGLVNRLASAENFTLEAQEWAAEIAHGPVRTMGLAKRVINKAHFDNLEQVLDYEGQIQDIARLGTEFDQGIQAFLKKQTPKFT